jgi:sulfate/thiosulfate transport system permease protein
MRQVLITIVWVYFVVLLVGPIAYLSSQAVNEGLTAFWLELTRPEALHGFRLTAEITAIVLVVNVLFGTMTAFVLTRHQFRGRALLSGLIDLPFAVSPVIAGFMLILVFGPESIVSPLFERLGITILFSMPAMVLATLFVTFPFVVRELTPVLQVMGTDSEEAASTLGATARLVMLPHESHGYVARESVLHALAEMVDWMDTHVRDAP